MNNRYLRTSWWVGRLATFAERIVPARCVMPAHVWSATAEPSAEPEFSQLDQWVSRDRLALDVGSNLGLYAWRLRRLAREVHAFEPSPALANRLAVALPGVHVHACALSDRNGQAKLIVPKRAGVTYHGWGTVEASNPLKAGLETKVEAITVPTRPLDEFGLDDVGFIKIDVEGHELAVLTGAEQTLRRCRPTLLVEADDRHRPGAVETVRSFLTALGYEVAPAISCGMWLGKASGGK